MSALGKFLFALAVSTIAAVCACAETPGSPLAEWSFEYRENLIWLKVNVGDSQPLNFILDSASTMNVIDPEEVAELHLSRGVEKIEVRRTDFMDEQPTTEPVDIRVGSLRFPDTRLLILPLSHPGGRGRKIDGILGLPLFERFLVQIDYAKSKVRVFSKGSQPANKHSDSVPLHLEDGLLSVMLKDVSGHEGNFIPDTGFSGGIALSPNAGNDYSVQGPSVASILYAGTKIRTRRYSKTTWSLGHYKIENMETFLCREPANGLFADKRWSGMIGNRFLSNFKATFNLQDKCMYLEAAR